MNGPLLRIDRIVKRFGARTVLDLASVELQAGRSYALTGDNGSGKTTLLRILAGLEPAQAARGAWCGRPVDFGRSPDDFRRDVIYVHQHPYLFRRSVRDNVAYGLDVRATPRGERDRLVGAAVEWARLQHLLDSPAQSLSAGEKQRVALARVRVLRPRLFLLDEPTANLDAEARQQTLALVEDLCDADGAAVIACHDPEVLALPGIARLHLADGKLERRAAGNDDDVASHARRRSSRPVAAAAVDPMLWHPVAND